MHLSTRLVARCHPSFTHSRVQVDSLPPRVSERIASVLGDWYLRFAIDSHTRLWLGAIVTCTALSLAGAAIFDIAGATDDKRLTVYNVVRPAPSSQSLANACFVPQLLTLAVLTLLFLSTPVFDRHLLGLVWRQVNTIPVYRRADHPLLPRSLTCCTCRFTSRCTLRSLS